MPIYEYECLKCGQRFELRRHITDSDSDVRCPKCGTEKPQRVISAFMMGPTIQVAVPLTAQPEV